MHTICSRQFHIHNDRETMDPRMEAWFHSLNNTGGRFSRPNAVFTAKCSFHGQMYVFTAKGLSQQNVQCFFHGQGLANTNKPDFHGEVFFSLSNVHSAFGHVYNLRSNGPLGKTCVRKRQTRGRKSIFETGKNKAKPLCGTGSETAKHRRQNG